MWAGLYSNDQFLSTLKFNLLQASKSDKNQQAPKLSGLMKLANTLKGITPIFKQLLMEHLVDTYDGNQADIFLFASCINNKKRTSLAGEQPQAVPSKINRSACQFTKEHKDRERGKPKTKECRIG